jgi:hypothetical protein
MHTICNRVPHEALANIAFPLVCDIMAEQNDYAPMIELLFSCAAKSALLLHGLLWATHTHLPPTRPFSQRCVVCCVLFVLFVFQPSVIIIVLNSFCFFILVLHNLIIIIIVIVIIISTTTNKQDSTVSNVYYSIWPTPICVRNFDWISNSLINCVWCQRMRNVEHICMNCCR